MKVALGFGGITCECGWLCQGAYRDPEIAELPLVVICTNPECVNRGKKFRQPSIELEEIKP